MFQQILSAPVLNPEVVGLFILIIAVLAIKRLTIHPYAKYPGPIFNKVSGLPTLYHAWKGDLHYHLYELHQKYGEKVRCSPNKLSICDVQAANDIYGFNKNVGKPEEFYSAFRVNVHAINTFNASSKAVHRRKRRIMTKAFSDSALISYEGFIANSVADFLDKLRHLHEERAGVFDFAYEFNCLMLDIMGGLCFGEAFGFVAGKGDRILKQAHRRAFRIYMTGHEPLLKKSFLDRLLFPGLLYASNVLGNYAKMNTDKRIAKHIAQGNTKMDTQGYSDIMTHLLDAGDEETGTVYSDNELLGEGVLMMMAGSDTSSSSLTATLFYLAHHHAAMQKLRKELHSRFPSAADINPRETETCEYLRACINESMRLSPPAPTNIPRIVGPGGIDINGDKFPGGVYVGTPNFALFRDARYFGTRLNNHAWIPERWIVGATPVEDGTFAETTEEEVKLAQSAFMPFSMGPRACIGRRLAVREVSFIMASLLYKWEICPVGHHGVLKRALPNVPNPDQHKTLEQLDVYTSLEHDVKMCLKKPE